MQNKKRPSLLLIGLGSVLTSASFLSACDDSSQNAHTVKVLRTGYATQEDCIQDWGAAADCTPVATAPGAASGGGPGSTALDTGAASGASGTDATGNDRATHGVAHGVAHWYGPYYTRQGRIYHASGSTTTGSVPAPRDGSTTELVVRESALSHDSDVFSRAPESVKSTEGAAISRGGFTSEGEEGHGTGEGGHGGGEGGGHGSGGG